MSQYDHLKFPSGRAVSNIKKDAKRLRNETGKTLNECLDLLARANGGSLPTWSENLAALVPIALLKRNTSHLEMTMNDLLALSQKHSTISQYGMGISNLRIARDLQVFHDPAKEAVDEFIDGIVKEERDSAGSMLGNCNKALVFIDQLEKQPEINKDSALKSYELKHIAERVFTDLGYHQHFHHGAFIFAALHRGFSSERCSPDSLSLFFNISPESPILKWDRDVNASVARAMIDHLKVVDPPRFADI